MPSGVFMLIGFCLGVCITVIVGLVRVLMKTLEASELKIELMRHRYLASTIANNFRDKPRTTFNGCLAGEMTERQERYYNQGIYEMADRMVESFEKKGNE